MRVISQAVELQPGARKVCVALGMFDGVHLGHKRVLSHTVEQARNTNSVSVAITFDRHPNSVVAPGRTPPLIYTVRQRLRAIEALQLDAVWLIRFDHAFSQQSGETFIQGLLRDFGALQSVCIGSNFTFGHKRSGNVLVLRALGEKLGFNVEALPSVLSDGAVVSSTRIRGAIELGDLAAVGRMMGRRYSLAGEVVQGDQLGRRLGFPTANLNVAGLAHPPAGVYAGQAIVDGTVYKAVMNIGFRPTLDRPERSLRAEAHLLEFSGDLYGRELEFVFFQKLRAELKFATLDALKEQIAQDVSAAEAALAWQTRTGPETDQPLGFEPT
jgi:riboflavin kinase/FMN adenylyltransferase